MIFKHLSDMLIFFKGRAAGSEVAVKVMWRGDMDGIHKIHISIEVHCTTYHSIQYYETCNESCMG